MLQLIRDKVTGWIAAIIMGLLIIPFAFWGINYYFDNGGSVNAASVNGAAVSLQQFQQAYQNLRRQWQDNVGSSVPAEQETALKQRAIDALVDRELLNQVNADAGLRISDDQLAAVIKNLGYFQGATGFDRDIYERTLMSAGLSPAEFEAQTRQDLLADQLQNGLAATAFITKTAAGNIARILQQKRDISYAVLSSDAAKEALEISDEDVKQRYESNAEQYMEPEQVRIAYIEIALESIAAEVTTAEPDLTAYYEANKNRYNLDEQRKYQELFFNVSEGTSDEAKAGLRAKAVSILDRIRGGATLDELAKEQDSEHPVFEKIDMDFMTRGIMEPEVDEVLFTLKAGETSDILETKTGFRILQVQEIKGGSNNTFEDVRAEVEKDYRNSQAEPRYYELADQLVTLAFEHPDSLEVAAEELKLPVRESGFFSRSQQAEELLRDPKIIAASFSEEVLEGGNNSEAIELENNRTVVLRAIDHKTESKKPLESVREEIITRLRYERSRDQTKAKGDEIIKALRAEQTKDAVASQYSLNWTDKSGITRDDSSADFAILKTSFGLGKPETGKNLVGGASLASGDYAVIIVSGIHEPELADLDKTQLEAIEAQLNRMNAIDGWTQYLKSLRKDADITIFQDNL